jgi:hypothetical protein
MASYVIVWENNTFGHQKVKEHTWPGHSSMNIGNAFDKETGSPSSNYVSWWPVGHAAQFDLLGALSGAQKGTRSSSFIRDVIFEGYLPDHVIKMATTAEQEEKMRAAWCSIFNKRGGASYKEFRKNCSTIVARILHARGVHAKKWAVDCNWVWTPADVAGLAKGAGGASMKWRDFQGVLAASKIDLRTCCKVDKARSGRFCTTGAPCKYQQDG